jgi:hypothetical protein
MAGTEHSSEAPITFLRELAPVIRTCQVNSG